ncbi:hypothetical protein FSP39_024280 [Pinctada imbricata]|uniref:C1q domain-containing protein n=1 Tax=Pinctada imbricata TaxID=66713 RepID=A0AA88XNW2_PINIB|nr:hypothetical protein FSP39_024280 [Pinctada imbricata]
MESAKNFSNRSKNGHLLSGNLDISTSGKRSLPSYDQIIRDRNGMSKPWDEKVQNQNDYLLNSADLRYEESTRGRNNPFIPESSVEISFPYSSRRRSIERTKWLAYAKSLRPGLNRKGSSSSSSNSGDNRYWNHLTNYDSSSTGYSDELPPRPQSVQSDILHHHHRDALPSRPNSVLSEVIRTEDLYSPRPASVQSEIIHDAYGNHRYRNHKRYHSIQSLNRPSRRMFSSGLHVRFSDEVEEYRKAHLELEPTEISHYDKKIRELFDKRYKRKVKKRYSSESPTPTTSGSDSDDTVGPHTQHADLGSVHMGNLERSVQLDSPDIQSPTNDFADKFDSVNRSDILQQQAADDAEYNDHFHEEDSVMKDWNSPQFYRDFQYNMYLDRPAGQKLLHLANPSPPDSAIDLDSSSVQSALSLDLHLVPSANEIPSDIRLYPSAIKQTDLSLDRRQSSQVSDNTDSVIGQQRKPKNQSDINHSYLTSGFQIDSDVDSGISQEPSNNGLGLLWSSKQTPNGDLTPRPASAVPFLSHNGRIQQNNTSSDEDDSIMREIQQTHVDSLRNMISRNGIYGIAEDEVDDTDPSFGIEVVKDDKRIQENYLQKRNPTRFIIKKSVSSSRCRPQSAPTWGGSHQEFISNDSTLLRKEDHFMQREVVHNAGIGGTEQGDHGSQETDLRNYNEYNVSSVGYNEAEFLTETEGGYGGETFVLDRRKLSQASSSDASTLSNSRYSNQDGGSTWREMEGNVASLGGQKGRLNKEIEDEIRMQSRNYPSDEENEATQQREVNLSYGRSHSYDRNLEEIASEEFPEISDKSAKKKFHFNIFKTKRGKYRPEFASSTQTLTSILKKPKEHERSRLEMERCRSEGNLLEEHHVRGSYHGSVSAENLLSNDLYANQQVMRANNEMHDRECLPSNTSSKSTVAESSARKFPGSEINEIEKLTSAYPQLLSPEIFRNERPVAVKLDQSDIQQLDDMYGFSDEDDDDEDDEDDSYEDDDVSHAVYPAEIEEAANLPARDKVDYADTVMVYDNEGSIYERPLALSDKNSASLDSKRSAKSPTLCLSVRSDLNEVEGAHDEDEQNEHYQPMASERSDLIHNLQPIENIVTSVRDHGQPIESSIRSMSSDSLPQPIESDVRTMSNDSLPQPIGNEVRSISIDSLSQPMGSNVRSLSNDSSLSQPMENNKTSLSTNDLPVETNKKYMSTNNLQISDHQDSNHYTGKKGKPLKREFSFSEPNLYTITDEVSLDGDHEASSTLPDHRYRGGTPNTGLDMYGFPVQGPSEQPIREENYPSPPIRKVGDSDGPIGAEDGCCRLLETNPDGTQLIQLSRPQDGPIGLYIAKGNSKFTHAKKETLVAFLVFSSRRTISTHPGAVVFDRANVNIGHAYNTHTGIFTAPVSGIYSFSISLTGDNGDVHGYIKQMGYTMGYVYADDTRVFKHNRASLSVTLHCRKGDRVWFDWPDTGNQLIYGNDFTWFSGHLVHEDH